MPAPHIDNDHASPPHSGSTSFDSRLAHMRAKTDTGLTLISISGEIDALNVDNVSHHVRELASDCGALIVDLAEVDFIALDGLHALIALNDQCARTGTTWALLASHAVNRLLRVEIATRYFPPSARRPRPYDWVRRSSRGRRSLQLVSPTPSWLATRAKQRAWRPLSYVQYK